MPTPLNLQPRGLLDLFGIKSGGWGPRELGQLLTPTFDLSRWYLDHTAINVLGLVAGSPFGATSLAAVQISVTTPTDITTAGALTVPQTEAWVILEATVRWSTSDAAGSVAAILRSRVINQYAFQWPMIEQGFTTGAAGITRGGSATLKQPFWVLPGEVIEVFIWGIVGAASSASLTTSFRIVRVRI